MIQMQDTAVLMLSEDYKERFVAEYWQTKNRYDRLHAMVVRYEAGTLEFKPHCPLDLLKDQKAAMGKYLYCLEVRAQIEQIPLDMPPDYWPSLQTRPTGKPTVKAKRCAITGGECSECRPGGCAEVR